MHEKKNVLSIVFGVVVLALVVFAFPSRAQFNPAPSDFNLTAEINMMEPWRSDSALLLVSNSKGKYCKVDYRTGELIRFNGVAFCSDTLSECEATVIRGVNRCALFRWY
jgi:hypothetical protein